MSLDFLKRLHFQFLTLWFWNLINRLFYALRDVCWAAWMSLYGSGPWERFSDWLHSICVVTFDLELGQALEVIYPGDALLSAQEKTNICYLAFPDSNSGNAKDTNFHFRIRRSTMEVTEAQRLLMERVCPSSGVLGLILVSSTALFIFVSRKTRPYLEDISRSNTSEGYLPSHGYLTPKHGRQLSSLKFFCWGGVRTSLVLMTTLPLFALYYEVVQRLALQFFSIGEPAIEAACHDVDHWPPPLVEDWLDLPFLGSVLRCRLPCRTDAPLHNHHQQGSEVAVVIPSAVNVDVYQALAPVINQTQLLWELIVTGQPLLVLAPSPSRSAAIVQALVTLISPLRYQHDFRPFFTIHDTEFKEYGTKGRTLPRVLLGVTNPFFVKALDHWPHILKACDPTEGETMEKKQDKTRRTMDGKTLDSKPGLYTQYKPFLIKEKATLKRISKADRPLEVQDTMMRRHFLELTQSFMIPLERYLSSLMPLKKEMSPFRAIPTSRPFSLEDFLLTVDGAGPSLTCGIKGDWAGLYKKFVTSANFIGWLAHRTKDVNTQLRAHYIEALCTADLGASVLSTKHHVEIVDLVLRIRERTVELDPTNEKRQSLVRQLQTILLAVDDDLKQVLMSNCSLREVLA